MSLRALHLHGCVPGLRACRCGWVERLEGVARDGCGVRRPLGRLPHACTCDRWRVPCLYRIAYHFLLSHVRVGVVGCGLATPASYEAWGICSTYLSRVYPSLTLAGHHLESAVPVVARVRQCRTFCDMCCVSDRLGQVPKIFLRSAKDDEKRRELMKNAEKFSSPHVFLGIS